MQVINALELPAIEEFVHLLDAENVESVKVEIHPTWVPFELMESKSRVLRSLTLQIMSNSISDAFACFHKQGENLSISSFTINVYKRNTKYMERLYSYRIEASDRTIHIQGPFPNDFLLPLYALCQKHRIRNLSFSL